VLLRNPPKAECLSGMRPFRGQEQCGSAAFVLAGEPHVLFCCGLLVQVPASASRDSPARDEEAWARTGRFASSPCALVSTSCIADVSMKVAGKD